MNFPTKSFGIVGAESSFNKPVSARLKSDCIISSLSLSLTLASLRSER